MKQISTLKKLYNLNENYYIICNRYVFTNVCYILTRRTKKETERCAVPGEFKNFVNKEGIVNVRI